MATGGFRSILLLISIGAAALAQTLDTAILGVVTDPAADCSER